jgi:hypothetical protein
MAGNLYDVDTSEASPLSEGFKAVPPGMYELFMESSDKKTTNDGEGEYLACVFVVGRGEHEGAKIFCNFNFWNKNQKAVDIAKSSWRALCEVTLGQPNAINNDSASLHNKLFVAEISNKPAYNKETGKNDHPTYRSNEIVFRKGTILSSKEYFAAQSQAKDEPKTEATVPTKPVKPGAGKPPWVK